MGMIKEYGLAGAVREYFKQRAEARKPPLTECQQIKKAMDEIVCAFTWNKVAEKPYKAGRYTIDIRSYHYDGEHGTDYSVKFKDTVIWSATYFGPYNPFEGKWHLSGPWVEDMLNTLLVEAFFRKGEMQAQIEADVIRQENEYQDEVRAAEERHQNLIQQFHNGE